MTPLTSWISLTQVNEFNEIHRVNSFNREILRRQQQINFVISFVGASVVFEFDESITFLVKFVGDSVRVLGIWDHLP